jgi:hypothetical protein
MNCLELILRLSQLEKKANQTERPPSSNTGFVQGGPLYFIHNFCYILTTNSGQSLCYQALPAQSPDPLAEI